MAEFTNRVPNEPDGKMRYNAINRSGETILQEVTLVPASTLLCEGTPWTAACASRLLTLDTTSTPQLALDAGTY